MSPVGPTDPATTTRPAGGVGDRAGVLGGEPVELARAPLGPVQREAAAIAAKTVGQDDVGAGVDEGLMQRPDAVGMVGVPQFRALAGGEAHGEEVGAGRAVRQQRPAFGEKSLQHASSPRERASQAQESRRQLSARSRRRKVARKGQEPPPRTLRCARGAGPARLSAARESVR